MRYFFFGSGEGSIDFNGIFDLCFLFSRLQICCVVISFLSVLDCCCCLICSDGLSIVLFFSFVFFVISCFTFIYLLKLYCCLMVRMTFSFSKGFISLQNLGQSFSPNCTNFSVFIFGLFLLYWLSSLKVSLLLI